MFNKKPARTASKNARFKKLDELILTNAKLRFCPDQLQNLNYMFNRNLQDVDADNKVTLAKSVTERLVQRLVCGAAMIDNRFSSKFLITNKYRKTASSNNLEYIVRLDCLSTPKLYDLDSNPDYSIIESDADFPASYARLRLNSSSLKMWSNFSNSNGHLRRDKIQARMVELLAMAAGQESPNSPLHVDEAICCGIPGKIIDPAALHDILAVPSNEQLFYGPGGNVPRFPDPRDFRLAIIDEPSGIKVKVEFLSPALSNISINVSILVAIGVDSWPNSSDFPSRISLGHPDCLLYYQAAQTGMYLVGYGVQSSGWQIRAPAAEYVLLNHYGPTSTVSTVLEVLYNILDYIDHSRGLRKKQVSYKILNKYILLTAVLEELETNSQSPFSDMLNWSPIFLSTLVLKILDSIIPKLLSEFQPNYFFKKANLLVNPGHLSDDDFTIEANNVKSYLVKLFDESLVPIKEIESFQRCISVQEGEISLLLKWKDLVEGLMPPVGTRGRRFCFAGSKNRRDIAHTQYTGRQLEYIGLVLKSMLGVKQKLLKSDKHLTEGPGIENSRESNLEDVIFVLVSIMEQARDQYLLKTSNETILKNKAKIRSNYNHYMTKLVEVLRKDKELHNLNLEDDTVLVKTILKWLYKALDHSKRHLAPILRPYLSTIFSSSHCISCQLESIKQRSNNEELKALGSFCKLVNLGEITPAQGLIDAVNKDWNWAKTMLNIVEKHTLRLVFISEKDKVYRHILSLPSYQRNESGSFRTMEGNVKTKKDIRRQKTLPNRSYFNSILNDKSKFGDESSTPQHDNLKKFSPLTIILSAKHRRGEHRGCGDIFKAMATMQKLNVFQDAASALPQEERLELTEFIHNLQSSKLKKSLNKKWSATLPSLNTVSKSGETAQRYIPMEESAGVKIGKSESCLNDNTNKNSLLGTCRAARIREGSAVFLVEENFKMKKMLLNKCESFKF